MVTLKKKKHTKEIQKFKNEVIENSPLTGPLIWEVPGGMMVDLLLVDGTATDCKHIYNERFNFEDMAKQGNRIIGKL